MKLSIVTTLYNSAPYIEEFYQRITRVAQPLVGDDYEIIFVDDGSPDNSLEKAVKIHNQDSKVKVIQLSRNFGHHKAMMTGLSHAVGDEVFLIDADLEEEPELLSDFWQELHKPESHDVDVVYGVQKSRKGKFLERWTGEVYYFLLNKLLGIKHPKNICTARLMLRKYVNALLLHKETEMVISCLWIITGFNQKGVPVNKNSKGVSSYNFARKSKHVVNTITSFSIVPLYMILVLGGGLFLVSVSYIVFLVFNKVIYSSVIDGWTSLMVSVWTLGSLLILFLGIIGVYVAKTFIEAKSRPLVIVRSFYDNSIRRHKS